MLLKSLRTSIALNLAVLLLMSMLLIDLIMLIVTQQMLVATRVEKGRILITALSTNLKATPSDTGGEWRMTNPANIRRLLESAGGLCVLVVTVDGQRIFHTGIGCLQNDLMGKMAHQSAVEGKETTRVPDIIRGIFWRQSNPLFLAAPLKVGNDIVAGGCVLIPVDDIYSLLQRSQHILLIYALINTAILTLLGIYRLNKITVKPIQRLVKRAEAYRESEDNVFMLEKQDNEFSQLSKSLNRMMVHQAQDKEKLQNTIHSLEKANRDLEKAQRDLIRAEKLASVGRLSAGIAHEIGNPIGIIKGYLALLTDRSISDEEKVDFIVRTESEVERINSIIQQLLDFARPSGKEQEVISVHQILNDLEDVCHFQPALACIQFQLRLEAGRDQVVANARQLRQVFLNLVLNAADAVRDSEGEGELVIQTALVDSSVADRKNQEVLEVRFIDNGPGISDESMTNIFDPFYTTKAPGKGTGLGLSVSFTLIEGLGGSIKAARNDNGGTCMTIMLPLAGNTTK
jgi:two-component system, NtrC family, sensor kinase